MAGPGIVRGIRRRSWRLRSTLLAAVAAFALAVVVILLATGALHRVELLSVDSRFDVRGDRGAPEQVVVVGIDDRTFDTLAPTFPFARGLHARVIRRLVDAGARVIAYDVQFTEPSPRGQEREDAKLFDAVEYAKGKILLATTEVSRRNGRVRTRVLGNDRFRRSLGAEVGNAVMPSDANGVVRRVRPAIDGLTSFSLVGARMARRATEGEPVEAPPADGAWIDFHGPAGTVPFASFGAVHDGRFDPALVRDKIVVVGATAPSLQDVAATSASGGELMSGPEIQAEAMATLLDGMPLGEVPGWVEVALAVALALIAPLAALRLRAAIGFFGALALAALYLVAAQLLFNSGTIIPVVVPLLGLTIGAVGSLAALLVVEALERQRVRDVFSHFVPSAVVDDVLARAGDELTLGGSSREVTVLFSDLRGFTTFSEGRDPHDVLEILNDYLSEMTEAILDHGGTLLAFLGDGILALFGAPLDQPDHRDRAVETAFAMLARLDGFNARMLEAGVEKPFRMGVGINTGPVMCGNVGSSRRLEYTAIGDAVNTASRIEGMTKDTGYPIHVAEATVDGLQRVTGLVEVGEMAVRGRQATIRLFGPAPAVAGAEAAEAPAGSNGHAPVGTADVAQSGS